MLVVEARGLSGGLAMMWKVKDEAKVINFSMKHIDVIVRIGGMEYG